MRAAKAAKEASQARSNATAQQPSADETPMDEDAAPPQPEAVARRAPSPPPALLAPPSMFAQTILHHSLCGANESDIVSSVGTRSLDLSSSWGPSPDDQVAQARSGTRLARK